jgi:hypothetical protein
MIVLVIVLLALAVMAYVSYPLWTPQMNVPARESTPRSGGRQSRSKAEFAVAPESLPASVSDVDELDLDRRAGRLDEQEYAVLQGARPTTKTVTGIEREPKEDDEIEQRVRALRQERARRRPQPRDKGQER